MTHRYSRRLPSCGAARGQERAGGRRAGALRGGCGRQRRRCCWPAPPGGRRARLARAEHCDSAAGQPSQLRAACTRRPRAPLTCTLLAASFRSLACAAICPTTFGGKSLRGACTRQGTCDLGGPNKGPNKATAKGGGRARGSSPLGLGMHRGGACGQPGQLNRVHGNTQRMRGEGCPPAAAARLCHWGPRRRPESALRGQPCQRAGASPVPPGALLLAALLVQQGRHQAVHDNVWVAPAGAGGGCVWAGVALLSAGARRGATAAGASLACVAGRQGWPFEVPQTQVPWHRLGAPGQKNQHPTTPQAPTHRMGEVKWV